VDGGGGRGDPASLRCHEGAKVLMILTNARMEFIRVFSREITRGYAF